METSQLFAASGVCQVKTGRVSSVRWYYHLELVQVTVCQETETEEMSGGTQKKRKKAVGKA